MSFCNYNVVGARIGIGGNRPYPIQRYFPLMAIQAILNVRNHYFFMLSLIRSPVGPIIRSLSGVVCFQ